MYLLLNQHHDKHETILHTTVIFCGQGSHAPLVFLALMLPRAVPVSDWERKPVTTSRAEVGCVGFMNLWINELSLFIMDFPRATEVKTLLIDPTKAKQRSSLTPKIGFHELVSEIVKEYLGSEGRDELIKGYCCKPLVYLG